MKNCPCCGYEEEKKETGPRLKNPTSWSDGLPICLCGEPVAVMHKDCAALWPPVNEGKY